MATKQRFRQRSGDTRFQGVYYRPTNNAARPYVAWVCCKGRAIQLGYFQKETEAAVVADFARYLIWGPNPKTWYPGKRRRRVSPPNFPPVAKLPCNPEWILSKLSCGRCLDAEAMHANRIAYDRKAATLSPATCLT
jgi:hypothetical protein